MSDDRFLRFIQTTNRMFDAQDGTSGTDNMGNHQVEALRQIYPELYTELLETDMWPFDNTMAHVDMTVWMLERLGLR